MLLLQGAQVQSLVGELRSHTQKKKKNRLLYLLQQRRHQCESVWTSKQLNNERGEKSKHLPRQRELFWTWISFPKSERNLWLSPMDLSLVPRGQKFRCTFQFLWAETYLICFHVQHELSWTLSHRAFSGGLGTRSYGLIICCCEINNVRENIGLPSTLFRVPEGKGLISAQLRKLQVCTVRCCELLLLYSVQPYLHFAV